MSTQSSSRTPNSACVTEDGKRYSEHYFPFGDVCMYCGRLQSMLTPSKTQDKREYSND